MYNILLGNFEVLYNTGKIFKKSLTELLFHSFLTFKTKQKKTGILSLPKVNVQTQQSSFLIRPEKLQFSCLYTKNIVGITYDIVSWHHQFLKADFSSNFSSFFLSLKLQEKFQEFIRVSVFFFLEKNFKLLKLSIQNTNAQLIS